MKTTLLFLIMLLIGSKSQCQVSDFPKSNVSYSDFEKLVKKVKKHRQKRLISFDEFLNKGKKANVIILDTRSKKMYDRKHIKGAIHLNFSDFTQQNLNIIIPTTDTTILIYCNNNFRGDEINFTSKIVLPKIINKEIDQITLALNIPTYINLYGYGYRNVYELSELISIVDQRIEYSGSEIEEFSN